MTKYGRAILNIVTESRDHLTAGQLYDIMKKDMPGLVLATVYNNLKRLCSEGRIKKVIMEGQPDRYDRVERHDHMVCRKCGRLEDVYLPDLTKELQPKLPDEMLSYDLRIDYICPDCRKN